MVTPMLGKDNRVQEILSVSRDLTARKINVFLKEIFETLKNKTSTTNTGIGLALVKKIVLGEGGELWLDSKGDRGCKFCFTWKK